MKKHGLVILLVFILSNLSYAASVKKKGIPCGPNVPTMKSIGKSQIAFYRRTWSEAYLKHGVRSPKWDQDVLKVFEFLEYNATYQIEEAKIKEPDFIRLIEKVVKLGCTDPHVLYRYGIVCEAAGRKSEAKLVFKKAFEGFKASKLPRIRAAYVAFRYFSYCDAEEKGEVLQILYRWLSESLSDGSFKKGEDEIFLSHLIWPTDKDKEKRKKKQLYFYNLIKKNGKDFPYAVKYIGGKYHTEEAWRCRGSGWASTVTEEGWKGFKENLTIARTLLTDAWKLNPKIKYAPSAMITLSMAGEAGEFETARLWFDRAVSVCFDDEDPYEKYLNAIMPRWGGSLKKMYEFGLECFETKRFDTSIPKYFLSVLMTIRDDGDEGIEYWHKPGNYEKIKLALEKWVSICSPEQKKWYQSILIAIAWSYGDHRYAWKKKEELGKDFDPEAFARILNIPYNYAISNYRPGMLYFASTSEAREEAHQLYEKALASKDPLEVIDLCTRAIKLEPGLFGAYYIRGKEEYYLIWSKDEELKKKRAYYFRDAKRDLSDYIDFQKNNANAFTMRAHIINMLDRREDFELAARDMERAMALRSKLRRFDYNLRGEIYCKVSYNAKGTPSKFKQFYKKALDDFNKATELDPKHPDSYSNRAELYYKNSEYLKASIQAELAAKYGNEYWIKYLKKYKKYKNEAERIAEANKDPVFEGKKISEWKKQLKDNDIQKKVEAIGVMEKTCEESALNDLTQLQHYRNAAIKRAALSALKTIRTKMVKSWINQLKNKTSDAKIKREALNGLNAYATLFRETVERELPLIIGFKDDEDPKVRSHVLNVVARLNHQPAVPIVIKALDDKDAIVRSAAAYALGDLKATSAVPHLIKALDDEDFEVRKNAVWVLGRLKANAAVPALTKMLDSKQVYDRRIVIKVLAEIDDKSAVSAIKAAFEKEQDSENVILMKMLLCVLGEKEYLSDVVEMLKHKTYWIRQSATKALGKINDKTTVPALIEAMKNGNDLGDTDRALMKITGQNFNRNRVRWQKWWEMNKDEFLKSRKN